VLELLGGFLLVERKVGDWLQGRSAVGADWVSACLGPMSCVWGWLPSGHTGGVWRHSWLYGVIPGSLMAFVHLVSLWAGGVGGQAGVPCPLRHVRWLCFLAPISKTTFLGDSTLDGG
jgi:hypothetical protein